MNKQEIKEIVYETIKEVAYEYFNTKATQEKGLMRIALINSSMKNNPESALNKAYNEDGERNPLPFGEDN